MVRTPAPGDRHPQDPLTVRGDPPAHAVGGVDDTTGRQRSPLITRGYTPMHYTKRGDQDQRASRNLFGMRVVWSGRIRTLDGMDVHRVRHWRSEHGLKRRAGVGWSVRRGVRETGAGGIRCELPMVHRVAGSGGVDGGEWRWGGGGGGHVDCGNGVTGGPMYDLQATGRIMQLEGNNLPGLHLIVRGRGLFQDDEREGVRTLGLLLWVPWDDQARWGIYDGISEEGGV